MACDHPLMSIVVVQPFMHRQGHFRAEARGLIEGFSDLGMGVRLVTAGGRLAAMEHFFTGRISSKAVSYMQAALATWKALRAGPANIVALDVPMVVAAGLAATVGRHSAVLLRSVDPMRGSPTPGLSIMRLRLESVLVRMATRRRAVFVIAAGTSSLADAWRRASIGPSGRVIQVVPFGSSKEVVRGQVPGHPNRAGKTVILAFGVRHAAKDLRSLLEAAVCLPQVHFEVVGKDAAGHVIKWPELPNLNVVNRYIDEEGIGDIFAAADAVYLGYRSGFYAPPSVLHLAMEHGRPVLASGHDDLTETVSGSGVGWTFESENSGSLVSAIRRAEQCSEDEYTAIVSRCIDFASERSWEEIAARYRRALDDCI